MSALPHLLPGLDEQRSTLPLEARVPANTFPGRAAWKALLPRTWRVFRAATDYLRQQGRTFRLLQTRHRRLRVQETVSLGDKRFVSILEVDGQAFLLGGSGTGLTLLATLTPVAQANSFERVLQNSLAQVDA